MALPEKLFSDLPSERLCFLTSLHEEYGPDGGGAACVCGFTEILRLITLPYCWDTPNSIPEKYQQQNFMITVVLVPMAGDRWHQGVVALVSQNPNEPMLAAWQANIELNLSERMRMVYKH